ncbi:MAG TPA: hypothetical protein P5137_08025 [Candidatus Brocadiia bacterium]|nr:hypothetical protein [Candidatus Brocadiia bacterium]
MPGELPTGKAREWRLNVVKDIRQAALLDSETKAAEVRVMFSRDGAVLEVVELTLTCLQA